MTSTFEAGPTIDYEVRDGVCWLSMERPEAKNALNYQLKSDLVAALAEYGRRPDLVAMVLSGSDCGAFCAGGDLKEVAKRPSWRARSRSSRPSTAMPSAGGSKWPWCATCASPPAGPRSACPSPAGG
jgi:enoyl-CoA hydratase/carnithine racemase